MSINLKSEAVKERILQVLPEDECDDLLFDLNNYYNYCRKKYYYLRASDTAWTNLFIGTINSVLEKELSISMIVKQVEATISKTIQRNLGDENMVVFTIDGILRDVNAGKNSEKKLSLLIRNLKIHSISIDSILYERLKRESIEFKRLLKSLGIEDFSKMEFDNLLRGNYANYMAVRPVSMSLRDCIVIAEYFYGLLDISREEVCKFHIPSEKIEKVKFMVSHTDELDEIHKLYMKEIGDIERDLFCRTVISFDINKINDIFSAYQNYKLCEINQNRDKLFLYTISSKVQEMPKKSCKKRVHTSKYNLNRPKKPAKTFINPLVFNSFEEALYNFFPSDKNIPENIRRQIIFSIYTSIKGEKKAMFDDFLKEGIISNEALLSTLETNLYRAYRKRAQHYLHPIDRYTFFPECEKISSAERTSIIDKIVNNTDNDTKKNIERFLAGDPTLDQNTYLLIMVRLQNMTKSYYTMIERFLNPQSLYDILPDIEGVSNERKIEIANSLLSDIEEEKKDDMAGLLNGTRIFTENAYALVASKITQYKARYRRRIDQVKYEIDYIQNLIKEITGIDMPNNLTFDQMYYFAGLLTSLKICHKEIVKKFTVVYKNFIIKCLTEAIMAKESSDLSTIISAMIKIAYNELQKIEQEKKKSELQ